MCIVSNILDYGRDRWPQPAKLPWNPWDIETTPITPYPRYPRPTPYTPAPILTPEQIDELMKLIEAAKKFDTVANQPDCEDPEKEKWIEEIKEIRAKMSKYEVYTNTNGYASKKTIIAETWEIRSDGSLIFWQDKASRTVAAIFASGQWTDVQNITPKGEDPQFLQD
jgi:hypothetical protein